MKVTVYYLAYITGNIITISPTHEGDLCLMMGVETRRNKRTILHNFNTKESYSLSKESQYDRWRIRNPENTPKMSDFERVYLDAESEAVFDETLSAYLNQKDEPRKAKFYRSHRISV